jgi:solute carrier family 35, member C2
MSSSTLEDRTDTDRHDEESHPLPPPSNFCRTAATILVWFGMSNATILATKWLFSNHFPFPLTVTMFSNVIASLWALLLSCVPRLRPQQPLTKQLLSEYVLPIGVCVAVEIGCSNLALKILSVSFGTILKGGAPVFTFIWGLLLGLEQFSWSIMGALVTIALGIALASLGEGEEFQALGFCLQLISTCLAGLRWAMTHKLLKGRDSQETKMSPLTATLYTSPTTALCVMPFAMALEAKTIWTDSDLATGPEAHLILAIMVGIATLVFSLIMSEYWLVNATSSLALSVAGVFKELLTISGALFFFAEHIDLLNVVGFVTCQAGILIYVFLRYDNTQMSYSPVTPQNEDIMGSKSSISRTERSHFGIEEVELSTLRII